MGHEGFLPLSTASLTTLMKSTCLGQAIHPFVDLNVNISTGGINGKDIVFIEDFLGDFGELQLHVLGMYIGVLR